MKTVRVLLCAVLMMVLMSACVLAEVSDANAAAGEALAIRGIYTGSFSEVRGEKSAQAGMVDCLVVFDCAAEMRRLPDAASGITLDIGGNAYEIYDTGSNLCAYVNNLHRYCEYGEPIAFDVPDAGARMLALFYVDPNSLSGEGEATLTVGDQAATFPVASIRAIDLPDEILAAEDDPEAAHRLADWRWRMDSIAHFDAFCERVYIDSIRLVSGDHFRSLSTAFKNLLNEDIQYGLSVAAEPTGSFYETEYGVLFDGGAYGLTPAEPALDLTALMRALPDQVGLIQYLVENTREAAKTMANTNIPEATLERLRTNVGLAYLDLCDAIGLPDLCQFFQKHPGGQKAAEFIQGLRDSGAHVSEEDIAKAEANANAALKNNKETVKAVQQALNDAGFDCGKPDGSAGKKTAAAISAYQQANGLEETGEISFALLNALGL